MVEIYSTDPCPYCQAAKRLLDSLGVEYQEHMMDASPESRQRVMDKTGGMSFPQILIQGQPVGGFQELQALHRSGELEKMLAA